MDISNYKKCRKICNLGFILLEILTQGLIYWLRALHLFLNFCFSLHFRWNFHLYLHVSLVLDIKEQNLIGNLKMY